MPNTPSASSEDPKPASDRDIVHDWLVSFAHGVGQVMRSVVDGFDKVQGAMGPSRRPQPGVGAEPPPPYEDLLQQLGQMVTAQSGDGGYASLADNREFDRLLEQLYRARCSRNRKKRIEAARARQASMASGLPATREAKNAAAAAEEATAAGEESSSEGVVDTLLDGVFDQSTEAPTETAAEETAEETTKTRKKK